YYSQTYLEVGSFYETGAALRWHFGKQTFGFQVTNDLNEPSDMGASIAGLYWYGNLLDGKLLPIANVHALPTADHVFAGQEDLDRRTRLNWALGAKWHVSDHFELDLVVGAYNSPS